MINNIILLGIYEYIPYENRWFELKHHLIMYHRLNSPLLKKIIINFDKCEIIVLQKIICNKSIHNELQIIIFDI